MGCWFGCVELAKNADPDKYVHSEYGIGFDLCSQFSLSDSSVGKNVIIFGVDILIIGKGPTKGYTKFRTTI